MHSRNIRYARYIKYQASVRPGAPRGWAGQGGPAAAWYFVYLGHLIYIGYIWICPICTPIGPTVGDINQTLPYDFQSIVMKYINTARFVSNIFTRVLRVHMIWIQLDIGGTLFSNYCLMIRSVSEQDIWETKCRKCRFIPENESYVSASKQLSLKLKSAFARRWSSYGQQYLMSWCSFDTN